MLLISFPGKRTASESCKLCMFLSMVSMTLSWRIKCQYLDQLRYVGKQTWKFFVWSSICLKVCAILVLSSSFSKILFHVTLFNILPSSTMLSTSILHNIRTKILRDGIEHTQQSTLSSPLILLCPRSPKPYSQQ